MSVSKLREIVIDREPSMALCADLEGWDEGMRGGLKREVIYV